MTSLRAVVARHVAELLLVLVVIAAAVAMVLARRDGHWWGDDWALYLRQADSLLSGTSRQVVADNEFSVEVSGLPEFSPPAYPWGYPLLLAPFVAVFGADLDRLVIAQVLFMAWFLVMWFRLARPRTGTAFALLATLAIGLSPQYVRWTEFIQSEPAFMAVAATALVVLDRQPTRRALLGPTGSWWPLVAVGALAAAAFSVRREGLAVVAAIGMAQLIAVSAAAAVAARAGSIRSLVAAGAWRHLLARLALPHLTALVIVLGTQLVLPSTLVPRYRGNGVHNVWGFAADHLGHILATLGLRDVLEPTPTVLGNAFLGVVMVLGFVTLTMFGVVWSAWRRPAEDLPIAAFALGALLIGGSFRYPGIRYVAIIGPMLLLFTGAAVRAIAGAVTPARRPPRLHTVVAIVLLAPLVVANAARTDELVADALEFNRAGQVQWGPDHPDALEMFTAVRSITGVDDVVGFDKARAMTQRTDRRALQVDQWRPLERLLPHLDLIVVERGTAVSSTVVAALGPARIVWSNPRFLALSVP